MSGWWIFGIVLAIILGLAVLVYVVRRQKKQSQQPKQPQHHLQVQLGSLDNVSAQNIREQAYIYAKSCHDAQYDRADAAGKKKLKTLDEQLTSIEEQRSSNLPTDKQKDAFVENAQNTYKQQCYVFQ